MFCNAFSRATLSSRTLPLEFVKGPEILPSPSCWHVGQQHADLSLGILQQGSYPQIVLGEAQTIND